MISREKLARLQPDRVVGIKASELAGLIDERDALLNVLDGANPDYTDDEWQFVIERDDERHILHTPDYLIEGRRKFYEQNGWAATLQHRQRLTYLTEWQTVELAATTTKETTP